jgi:hypothetical protein|tara:strand:- start:853 stop:1101 length:249 start_codon:yes stop_codon:yes gene_type:complete
MSVAIKKKILWLVVIAALAVTWMPYFDIFNSSTLIVGLPQSLVVTLVCNVVLTVCVFALYPLCFTPLVKRIEEKPLSDGGVK